MPTHLNLRYVEIEDALESAKKLENLAESYGIDDVYADNAVKALQLAIATGVDLLPSRIGPDAVDRVGNEYAIKTINLDKRGGGFSTSHHMNTRIINKMRKLRHIFAMYHGSKLHEAYLVDPEDLEPTFKQWEKGLKGRTHLNNPKIPVDEIRRIGTVMYMKDVAPSWAVADNA